MMAPSLRKSTVAPGGLRSRSTCTATTTTASATTSVSRGKTGRWRSLSGNGNVNVNANGSLRLGRVTKRSGSSGRERKKKYLNVDVDVDVDVDVQENELVNCEEEQERVVSALNLRVGEKRKRDESENESESESGCVDEGEGRKEAGSILLSKKRRVQAQRHIQLLSPPASRDGTDCDEAGCLERRRMVVSPRTRRTNAVLLPVVELPQSLLDLVSMHGAFLKALSLHYAHNGSSTPAELGGLMDSMTRIWKKQSVRRDAMQRMLGLYELAMDSMLVEAKEVVPKQCPFRIVTSGLGLNVRTNLEYVGQATFNEARLQATFSDMVHSCFKNSLDLDDSTKIPLLTITLGTQTSLNRAKAASTRAEILSLSASTQSRSAPDFSKLSISEPLDHTPAAVKSRTLSLFDRVRAKGLASANNTAQTAEQITRQHAIGRISEVVEFLRMKQRQKLSAQFQSSMQESSDMTRTAGKVSFSLSAIVRDIRQSVGVPIGEEEVRACLRILSQEIPGDWCQIIELGVVVSITLQGSGLSGVEVKRMLDQTASRK